MILTNRLFERSVPAREAKSIYIFCEGAEREYDYFTYFVKMDSRINIEVYKLRPHEDNSPMGLLKKAKECIIKSQKNPNPKYNFLMGDEVWIVFDADNDKTESRLSQAKQVKSACEKIENWHYAISNPCFEVWLYYHCFDKKPVFEKREQCAAWKQYVNLVIPGGFDSRKHPIYIEQADQNASLNFQQESILPAVGSTEIYKLAQSILLLLKFKIDKVLNTINKTP